MDKKQNLKRAKIFGILWIASSSVLAIILISASTHMAVMQGQILATTKSVWNWLMLLAQSLYLIPLLFGTQYYFKKAGMKKLTLAARIVLIHNMICTIFIFVFTVI